MSFYRKYLDSKKNDYPSVEVTHEEFIKLVVESGISQEEAEMQARIAKIMGSELLLNKRYVSIKQD